MSYWLLKSEPDVFGVDDLAAAPGRRTHWEGVRNYQARNFLRDQMKAGDLAFFYHSNCQEPGIAGIVKIVRGGYADDTAFDPKSNYFDPRSDRASPRWYMVDVKLERKLARVITLAELRRHAEGPLEGFALLRRGNRLSVMPVTSQHWQFILTLE